MQYQNKIEINYKYCGAGGECISVCPLSTKIWAYREVEFEQFGKGHVRKMRPVPVNMNLCTGCGRCASYCPVGAISVNGKGQRPVIIALFKLDYASCKSKDRFEQKTYRKC